NQNRAYRYPEIAAVEGFVNEIAAQVQVRRVAGIQDEGAIVRLRRVRRESRLVDAVGIRRPATRAGGGRACQEGVAVLGARLGQVEKIFGIGWVDQDRAVFVACVEPLPGRGVTCPLENGKLVLGDAVDDVGVSRINGDVIEQRGLQITLLGQQLEVGGQRLRI